MNLTKHVFLLGALFLLAFPSLAQDYSISEGGTVYTCTGTIYDSGGDSANYSDNESYIMSFCADDSSSCLQFDFVHWDVETGNWDELLIFDGPDTSSTLLGVFDGSVSPGLISAGGQCMTFYFTSDGSVTHSGFEIEITCVCPTCDDGILNGDELAVDCGGPDCPACSFDLISDGGTVTDCSLELYDSGYTNEYGVNEDHIFSFCKSDDQACIYVDFPELEIDFGDHLYIHAGMDTSGYLIADITDTDQWQALILDQDCLTFRFTSDGFGTAAGFHLAAFCTTACPDCDNGIQDGLEQGVDCGGPECSPCNFIVMDGEQYFETCDTKIYDNGYLGDYQPNSYDVLTVCTDSVETCLQASFVSFDIEGEPWDVLSVFSGPDTSSPLIGTYGDIPPPAIIDAGSSCLTFEFVSDGTVQHSGYEIDITCACPTCDDGIQNGQEIGIDCGGADCPACPYHSISEGGSLEGCGLQILDSGLSDDYGINEDYTMTVCSPNTNDSLLVEFLTAQVAIGDHLYIYDGEDMSGPLLADVTGAVSWPDVQSSSGCITLHFVSNGVGNADGFDLMVSCGDAQTTSIDDIDSAPMQIIPVAVGIWQFTGTPEVNYIMRYIDAAGRIVRNEKISSGDLLHSEELRAGIYLISVSSDDGGLLTKRIVIPE